MLNPAFASNAFNNTVPIMKWSFQLYSARNTEFDNALAIIADAGYGGVEAYRDNLTDPDNLRIALDNHRLELDSMHINIGPMRDKFEASMELARILSCRHIVCPYLEDSQRPQDTEGWKSLAEELSDLALRWKTADCTFAWHNHDFEFLPTSDGVLPMEILLANAPDMQWELDIAWIARAGADPLNWIERYPRRISAVHLKDIADAGECLDEDGWADLGDGVIDWSSLLESLQQTSASIFCMEHDNPSDLSRFANRSIEFANRELSQLLHQAS
jgi:sugar phosphate isomerase/epimerase